MHDGIELEKRGVPTITICTDAFIQTSEVMAKVKGFASYPLLMVPHPIGNLGPEELGERARQATPEVAKRLLNTYRPSG